MKPKLLNLLEKYGIKTPRGGIWVNDGWIPLVDKMLGEMIRLGWDKDLHQVKEKFGSLRVYTGDTNEEVLKTIERAQIASEYICECCGKYGTIRSKQPGTRLICICDQCLTKL